MNFISFPVIITFFLQINKSLRRKSRQIVKRESFMLEVKPSTALKATIKQSALPSK